MVRIAGLEPAHLAALPPQSSVSANSTICATEPVILPDSNANASCFRRTNKINRRAAGLTEGTEIRRENLKTFAPLRFFASLRFFLK
jgi:hypothetical protein